VPAVWPNQESLLQRWLVELQNVVSNNGHQHLQLHYFEIHKKLPKSILICWNVRMHKVYSKQVNVEVLDKCDHMVPDLSAHFTVFRWWKKNAYLRWWKYSLCLKVLWMVGVEGNGTAQWREQRERADLEAWRQVSTSCWCAKTSTCKVTSSF